jgi:hypothetical protein
MEAHRLYDRESCAIRILNGEREKKATESSAIFCDLNSSWLTQYIPGTANKLSKAANPLMAEAEEPIRRIQ